MPKLYPGYRDEIRKKIVNEAFTIFLEKGFEGTTMDDVAARLSVSKPAIYRYFKNKEDLFFVALGELVMNESNEIVSSSFSSDNLIEGSSAFFDAFLDINQKYAAIRKDVLNIIAKNEAFQGEIQKFQDTGQQTLQRFFEEQKKKGHIHPNIDEKDLSLACNALITGLMDNIVLGMDPAEGKRIWLSVFADLLRI